MTELHYACLTEAKHVVDRLLEDSSVDPNAMDHKKVFHWCFFGCILIIFIYGR